MGETIKNCGKGEQNRNLQRGIDWLARNFQVSENAGGGQQWKFYYLYGLERAGRLAGIRYFGTHDWYRGALTSWSSARTSSRGPGKVPFSSAIRYWRRASRCCSWPRAAHPS